MAQTSTIYNFEVALSNVDRGVYENLKLQLARHPSETLPYLLARLIAFCLEYEEGIAFSKGLSESDEPAIWTRDLTGTITAWIEIGSPAATRLHRASKLGARVVVYSHKDPELLLSNLKREEIFGAEKIKIFGLDPSFLETLGNEIQKRSTLSLSVSEGRIYINIAGKDFESAVQEYSLVE
jgi:uncharacterized protein YaeQ